MSLKERLNKEIKVEFKQEKPVFKPLAQEATAFDINSLGAIDVLLTDSEVNSIYVNGAKNVYIVRNGKTYQSTITYQNDAQLESLIKACAKQFGLEFDKDKPFIKFHLKEGVNVSMTLPPLTDKATIFVKCHKDSYANCAALLENRCFSKEIGLVLDAFSYLKENIIIAGDKNTLKTTLLSALSKKVPPHQKGIIIDYGSEISNDKANFTTFDFSLVDNDKVKNEIIKSVFSLNPDKVFVNDAGFDIVSYIPQLLNNYRGLVLTIDSLTKEEAIEKIVYSILEAKPHLNYEIASRLCSKIFKHIIFVSKDDEGKRRIESISQINQNLETEEIFYLDELDTHASSGIIPEFYHNINEETKMFSANIFDREYKHTYQKSVSSNDTLEEKKNIDILQKFKKKQTEQNIEQIEQETLEDVLLAEEENNSEV